MSYEQYCGNNYGRTSMRNRVQYSDFWCILKRRKSVGMMGIIMAALTIPVDYTCSEFESGKSGKKAVGIRSIYWFSENDFFTDILGRKENGTYRI